MSRALLFDLDGTLVDSVPDIAVAVDRLLLDIGREPAGEARARACRAARPRALAAALPPA